MTSLRSLPVVRESLGQMHTYVDKLFKEVNTSKILDRSIKSEMSDDDALSKADLAAINELGIENEHSFLN